MNNQSKFLIIISTLIAIFTITSCDEDCPETDVDAINAIYLQFKTNGDNSFSTSELDSVYMVRFFEEELDSFNFPVDTFLFFENGFYEPDYKIRLSKNLPAFENSGAPFYTAYKYKLLSFGQPWEVTLQEIELEGGYDSENCEYIPVKKAYLLNGEYIEVTGSEEYVQITKQ